MNNLAAIIPQTIFETDNIQTLFYGEQPFSQMREIQLQYIERMRANCKQRDTVLFCTHPSTISLGTRGVPTDVFVNSETLMKRGIELVKTDRGGQATYHGPGQLVIYPVVSLRNRKLGIKQFVVDGLKAIAQTLRTYGVPAVATLCPAGVWVLNPSQHKIPLCVDAPLFVDTIVPEQAKKPGQAKKIASAGLKVTHGITNHGFSLNVNPDLSVYSIFAPCGDSSDHITSMANDLDQDTIPTMTELACKLTSFL